MVLIVGYCNDGWLVVWTDVSVADVFMKKKIFVSFVVVCVLLLLVVVLTLVVVALLLFTTTTTNNNTITTFTTTLTTTTITLTTQHTLNYITPTSIKTITLRKTLFF